MDNVRVLLKAFILKDGKFLAVKRAPHLIKPNLWDIPGGNLEYKEDIEESLLREIKEESNLKIKNLKPLHVTSRYSEVQKCFRIEIGFACDYESGEIEISDEHSEFKWVTKNEFIQMNSQDFLKEFAKHL